MPIYTFICDSCGKEEERWLKITDSRDEEKCSCGEKMTLRISPCNFHLKGSGWYVSDYKNKPTKSVKKE